MDCIVINQLFPVGQVRRHLYACVDVCILGVSVVFVYVRLGLSVRAYMRVYLFVMGVGLCRCISACFPGMCKQVVGHVYVLSCMFCGR